MPTINIIGAGKLGSALGKIWQQNKIFTIVGVCNRRYKTAANAQKFIGAQQATATANIEKLPPADYWLIATPDSAISATASSLADTHHVTRDNIVFHCSGALSSAVLQPLQIRTQKLASAHPVHSFADPEESYQRFSGTWCGIEGQRQAIAALTPIFTEMGARLFSLNSDSKSYYHAATVMACNHTVALLDASLECLSTAGVDRATGQQLLLPLVQQTLTNALQSSCEQALTGPVSRGDTETVSKQLEALNNSNPQLGALYRLLSARALEIAIRQPHDPHRLNDLKTLLSASTQASTPSSGTND